MARPIPKAVPLPPDDLTTTLELLPLADLRPHPRNDGTHPPDELAHLKQSITTHGVYRNVVVAEDGTILAGHGVIEAARALGRTHIAGQRMSYGPDDPRALQLLVGDNHIARLRQQDDEQLVALLQELQGHDPLALLGTGFDAEALDALVAAQGNGLVAVPDPLPQQEPRLPSECFIEIYCAQSDLHDFQATLDTWDARATVRINIV